MKKYYTFFLSSMLCVCTSCEKLEYERVLIVVTDQSVQVPQNADAVTLKGAILDIGDLPVTEYGFCYRNSVPGEITITSANVNNIILTDKPIVSTFEKKIFNLHKNTSYAYRAFAKTAAEVKYGKQYYFRVGDITSPIFSAQVNNISTTTATALGSVSENQFAAVGGAIGEHGHCWAIEQNPEITDIKSALGPLIAAQNFTSLLTGLSAGTTYYVRAYIIPTGTTTPIYSSNEVEIKTVQ